MTKKPEAMPLFSLFVERNVALVQSKDDGKSGTIVDLAPTVMKRLKFELSLPTTDPRLREAIEDERDRCASESATRQLKHAANSEKGGVKSGQERRDANVSRNGELALEAKKLIVGGHAPHEICGILAQRQKLSAKQIRTILQDEGVLEKRRK